MFWIVSSNLHDASRWTALRLSTIRVEIYIYNTLLPSRCAPRVSIYKSMKSMNTLLHVSAYLQTTHEEGATHRRGIMHSLAFFKLSLLRCGRNDELEGPVAQHNSEIWTFQTSDTKSSQSQFLKENSLKVGCVTTSENYTLRVSKGSAPVVRPPH